MEDAAETTAAVHRLYSGEDIGGLGYQFAQGLQHFTASRNKLTGKLSINSDTLYTLDVAHNQLEQLEVQSCKKLKFVGLNSNLLRILTPDIGKCAELETLQLQENKLNTRVPDSFNQLKHLKTLSLAGNHLSCGLPLMKQAPGLGQGTYRDGKMCLRFC